MELVFPHRNIEYKNSTLCTDITIKSQNPI